jgi:hypothetical protein
MGHRCQGLLGCCLDSTTGSEVVAVACKTEKQKQKEREIPLPSSRLSCSGWVAGCSSSGEDADETTMVHGGFFFSVS